MEIDGYEIDLDKPCKLIKEKGYRIVGLEMPTGLKRKAHEISDEIENKTKAAIVTSANPCHGACDVADREMSKMGAQLLIHIGHSEIPQLRGEYDIPVIFIPAYSTIDVDEIVYKSLNELIGKKIGIVTNIQHINKLSNCKSILEKEGFEPIIGKGDERISRDGQLLGCNLTAGTSIQSKVDSYLYVGSGSFHPLGLRLAVNKTVIAADPYQREVRKFEKMADEILRQRWGAIEMAKHSEKIGILISKKKGQRRLELANRVKEIVNKNGMKGYLIELDEFNPSLLRNFDFDSFVSTACPRIAIDDYLLYDRPILTWIEFEILVGKRKWSQYEFDQILA